MSVTPYIWALWHTEFGKFLIILCIIAVIIQMLGWWTIAVVLGIALAILIYYLYDKHKYKKLVEENNRKEELRKNELNRLHKEYPYGVTFTHRFEDGEQGIALFWLVIGKTGNRPVEFDNGIFLVRFKIARNCRGLNLFLKNTSKQKIELDLNSFKINSKDIEREGKMWYDYGANWNALQPGEKYEKMLKPQPEYDRSGQVKNLFDIFKMKNREVCCKFAFKIRTENGEEKEYTFDLYSQCRLIRIE